MSVADSTLKLIQLATVVSVKQTPHVIPAKKDKDGNVIQKSQVVYTTTKTKKIDPKTMDSLFNKRSALFESLSQMRSKIKMPKVDQMASFPVWDKQKHGWGHETYTYSSLAKLIDAIDKGITDSKTHLSFTFNSNQKPITVQVYNRKYHKTTSMPGTRVSVSVRVADGKGGWAEDIGKFTLDVTGQDGQSIGGGYTYARRYSLSLALGVSGLKANNIKTGGNGTSLDESVASEQVNNQPAQASSSQIQQIERYCAEWAKVDHLHQEQPYLWLKKAHSANIDLNKHSIKMTASQANSAIRDMRSFIATQLAKPANAKSVGILDKAIADFAKTGGHAESKIYGWLSKTYNAKVDPKSMKATTKPTKIKITNANLAKALRAIKGFKAHEAKQDASSKKSANKTSKTASK